MGIDVARCLRIILDRRKRTIDRMLALGRTPARSIYDSDVPDSRVSDPRKRGNVSTQYGPASQLFCAKCGRPLPYNVTETMLKSTAYCFRCTYVEPQAYMPPVVRCKGCGKPAPEGLRPAPGFAYFCYGCERAGRVPDGLNGRPFQYAKVAEGGN